MTWIGEISHRPVNHQIPKPVLWRYLNHCGIISMQRHRDRGNKREYNLMSIPEGFLTSSCFIASCEHIIDNFHNHLGEDDIQASQLI